MSPTFSIIVATSGRPSLARTLAALGLQISDGDEILCVCNQNAPWGHATRNRVMMRAEGTHLWFMDDDDVPTGDALATIREQIAQAPNAVHVFKMQYPNGLTLWRQPIAEYGNVGTPMIVVPNDPEKLGQWDETKYEGDWVFLRDTLALRRESPVFHEQVVALIGSS